MESIVNGTFSHSFEDKIRILKIVVIHMNAMIRENRKQINEGNDVARRTHLIGILEDEIAKNEEKISMLENGIDVTGFERWTDEEV